MRDHHPRRGSGGRRPAVIWSRQAMAENWLEKGESHRALAFRIATKALRELEARGIPIPKDWHAIEKADKMARRAQEWTMAKGPESTCR